MRTKQPSAKEQGTLDYKKRKKEQRKLLIEMDDQLCLLFYFTGSKDEKKIKLHKRKLEEIRLQLFDLGYFRKKER